MVEVGAPPSFTLESFYDDSEWIPLNYVPISSLVSVRLATLLVTNEILMWQLFIYSAFVAMMFEPSTSHTRIWTATKDIMQRNVVPSHFCCLILFKYEAVPWCDFLYGTCEHFPGTPAGAQWQIFDRANCLSDQDERLFFFSWRRHQTQEEGVVAACRSLPSEPFARLH